MTDETLYPQIDIAGKPREMGISHGRQLRALIHKSIELMRAMIGPEAYDASWWDLQSLCAYGRRHAPALVEEIEGIAEGAGIAFRDAFTINSHLELHMWNLLVWKAGKKGGGGAGACSSHAVVTPLEVLLGWNGDDWQRWMECGVVIRCHPAAEESFLYWSTAGSIGRPGMNRHLAFSANTLPTRRWQSNGLLYSMLSRRILASRTAEEAVAAFRGCNASCGMNYLVADESGHLVSIEAHPDGFALVRPKDVGTENYLLHTNCFLHPDLVEPNVSNACPRLDAARRLYRNHMPSDVGGVRAILSDHTGGVCVHQPSASTIVSFVAEVRKQRFQIIRGNPCVGQARTYDLK